MDDLDELDIELRNTDDVGGRIILLTALCIWPDHETLADRDSWADWLAREGVLPLATHSELIVFNDHRERELVESDLEVCNRAFDALQSLVWACYMVDEIRLVIPDDGSADLLEGIPIPSERIEPFLDGLILRDELDIALERERAEVWNWRLAAERTLRGATVGARREIQEAISEVVLECAAEMIIPDNDGTDFLVDGAPVRSISDDLLDSLLVASEEHVRGLNWLCGLTEWDQIHLPD